MKRHLQPQPAVVVLSVEEEAILIDEQNQSTNELVALDADITRVMENEDVLADVQGVLSQIPQVSAVEIQLLDAVSDMAVAGTDADPEDILPAADGLSAESFFSAVSDRLAKMWEAIKEFILKTWAHIKAFFRSIANFFSPLKRQQDALQKELDKGKKLDAEIATKVADIEKTTKEINELNARTFGGGGNTGRVDIDFNGDVSAVSLTGQNTIVAPEQMVAEVTKLVDISNKTIDGFMDLEQAISLPVLEMIRKTMTDPNQVSTNMRDIQSRMEAPQKKFFDAMHFNMHAEKRGGSILDRRDSGYPALLGGLYVHYNRRLNSGDDAFDFFTYSVMKNKHEVGRAKTKSLTSDEVQTILDQSRIFTKHAEHPHFLREIESMEKLAADMIKMVDSLKTMRPAKTEGADWKVAFGEAGRDKSFSQMLNVIQSAAVVGTMNVAKVVKYTSEILKEALKLGHQAEKMTGLGFMGIKVTGDKTLNTTQDVDDYFTK